MGRDYSGKQIRKATRKAVLERDNFTCVYCGARAYEAPLEIDHVIPRSKGGTHNIDNLVTSCKKCNRKKRARFLDRQEARKIAKLLGTSVAYLMGETDDPNREANVSASVGDMQGSVSLPKTSVSYAYWGGVTDKARDVAVSGDEDAIVYVTQMLRRALSLLTCKPIPEKSSFSKHTKPSVNNAPFMLGDNNENNLTVAPVMSSC